MSKTPTQKRLPKTRLTVDQERLEDAAATIRCQQGDLNALRVANQTLQVELRKQARELHRTRMRLDACLYAMVLLQAQVREGTDRRLAEQAARGVMGTMADHCALAAGKE